MFMKYVYLWTMFIKIENVKEYFKFYVYYKTETKN